MKTKKSPSADLENKKTLFFEIGMIVALAAVFAAFQWSTKQNDKIILTDGRSEIITELMVPITRPEPPIPPELPKPMLKKDIVIVDNTNKIDETGNLFPVEVNPNVGIEVIPIPDETPVAEPDVIYIAEKMPEFPGGFKALLSYVAKHIQYPREAASNNVQGKVYVQFVVNKMGEVVQVRVLKGIDPLLDAEALRVVSKLPKWTPGMQNNKPVNVGYTIPINFSLNF